MTFTSDQQVRIKELMGYSPRVGGEIIDSAIEQSGNNSSIQGQVEDVLANLDTLEAKLYSTGILTAGLKSANNEAEFYQRGVIQDLRSQGRQLINRLSILIGAEINADYFGLLGLGAYGSAAGYHTGFFS